METPILYVVLAIQIGLIVLSLRRFGFSPFPTLAICYLSVAQFSLTMIKYDIWDYPFLNYYSRGGYDKYFIEVILVFTTISLLIMLFFIDDIVSGRAVKLKISRIELNRISGMIGLFNTYFIAFSIVYFFVMMTILNWSIVWSNPNYLAMTDPRSVVTIEGLGALLSLMPFVGIIAALVAAVNLSLDRLGPALYCGTYMMMISLYYVGAHQRVAILPPVAFFIVLSVVGRRSYTILRAAAFAFAAFAVSSGLSGRGSGEHGLSSIPAAFGNLGNANLGDILSSLVLNMTEGIFVFAETLTLQPTYPMIYKLLSFSPLPSVIDKFASVAQSFQVRLTYYVPMSGFSEAYFFGPIFLGLVVAMFVTSILLYKKMIKINQYVGLACGFLILLAMIQLFTYPLRNGLKALWIADIVAIAALVYFNRKKPVRPVAIDPGLRSALMGQGGQTARPMNQFMGRRPLQRQPLRRL